MSGPLTRAHLDALRQVADPVLDGIAPPWLDQYRRRV
jgi:hypothetical protein